MKTTARVQMALAAACAVAAASLLYVNVAPAEASAGPLSSAFSAVLGLEDVINLRGDDGVYVSQTEGSESLASRLSEFVTDTYVGVNGLGHATAAFGYQPTSYGAGPYADGIIAFRGLAVAADIADGGNGTADWVHVPYNSAVSGNVAYFVLNFEVRGTDGEPVELDLGDLGIVAMHGRCICTCVRIDGQWEIDAFYFVLSPEDMLYDVGE